MDEFDQIVQKKVYFWMGAASAGGFEPDDKGWAEIDTLYYGAWVIGLNVRLPRMGKNKVEWWYREGGEAYSRQCAERFAKKLGTLNEVNPNPGQIRKAYEETKSEMLTLLSRTGVPFGDILCP